MCVPQSDDSVRLLTVIYVKPSSSTAGQGLFGVLEIVIDPEGIEPNSIIDLIPLKWW